MAAVVLLYPDCIVAEVTEVACRLKMAGTHVVWASPDGQPITDHSGLTMIPDVAIAALLRDGPAIDALIIPGGEPEAIIGDPTVRRFVSQVAASNGTIAAICAGALVVADAGVAVGKRITHNYRSLWATPDVEEHVARLFHGVEVENDRSVGVVIDGNVITALPNATAEFSLSICRHMGIYDDEHARLLTRHLQGEYVGELFAPPPKTGAGPSADIRRADVGDLSALVELQIRLFAEDAVVHERYADGTWPEREGRADFEQLLASDSSLVLVADLEGTTIGFLVGYLTPSSPTRQPVTYAVLRSLYVDDDYRNSGAGSALTEHFLRWAGTTDAVEAHVSAYAKNEGAQRFYERHEFESHSLSRVHSLSR